MIEGRVAKILDDRQLVINRGSDSGVRLDMIFDVLGSESEEILDPETGEALGTIDNRKLSVKVIEVKEKLSIAATFRFSESSPGALYSSMTMPAIGASLADMLAPPRRTYERIGSGVNKVSKTPTPVKVGDPVRQARQLP